MFTQRTSSPVTLCSNSLHLSRDLSAYSYVTMTIAPSSCIETRVEN